MDGHMLQDFASLIPLAIETENMATASPGMNPIITSSTPHLPTGGLLPLDEDSNIWDLGTLTRSELDLSNSVSMEPYPTYPLANQSIPGTNLGPSSRFYTVPGPRVTKSLTIRMWEYAHDSGPRIIWPPEGCLNCDELDQEGIAPTFRQSIVALSQTAPSELEFRDVCHFYSNFLTRLFYDYSLTPDKVASWIFRRFHASKSSKYGMLALVTLYRSEYQRSMLATSWRADAKQLYSHAVLQFSQDSEDAGLSAWAKLTSLLSIMDFEYHTGELSKYYAHVTQAVPLIKAIVGSDTIDLFNLRGEQMFDVSVWVWCDILDSMATSRPTRVKYESDLERAAQPGTEENGACEDKGLEWLYGIPNAFAVILARTSDLRHSKLSEEEKALKGAELEQLIRNWQIRLLGAKGSQLRVARMGVQEVWRHTAILYVHHAIFKSNPSHSIVRDSVKNIIKIASTLEPGRNPDSFLYIPYFIAGFYAISQKDRYIMRSRLIGCANALYLRLLVRHLDELWQETDSAGRLTSWSEKKPPRIAF